MPDICTSVIRQAVLWMLPDLRYSSADANVSTACPNDLMRHPAASRTRSSSSITTRICTDTVFHRLSLPVLHHDKHTGRALIGLPVPSIARWQGRHAARTPQRRSGSAHLKEGHFDLIPPIPITLVQHCKEPREPSSAGLDDLGHALK
jgi:hypothetical protein